MKKKIIYFTIFLFIFLIFKNSDIVFKSTIEAVNIWLNKVFPYLFIMIIIQDILIKSNIISLFKNPSSYIFFMSIISGTPSSAYILSNLVKNNKIDKAYANKCLLFTYFNNPLFLYTIFTAIFKHKFLVYKLLFISYLSNTVIYLLTYKKIPKPKIKSEDNFSINIASSIKSSINTTTMILGTICFYLVISNILINTLSLNTYFSTLLKGFLEITQGLNSLINNNIFGKEIIAMFFISFGGLSIHTQVKCILDEANIDYKYFLKGRILQSIIALTLTTFTKAIW